MKNSGLFFGVLVILLLVSGCARDQSNGAIVAKKPQKKLQTEQVKQIPKKKQRKLNAIEKKYQKAREDHDNGFSVLTISESNQDQALKKIILQKNKEWAKKHMSVEQWIGTGLNEYESLPFITYAANLRKHIKKMKRATVALPKLASYSPDVDPLLRKVSEIIPQLEELRDITESHERYLQETDKYETITRFRYS